MKPIVLVLMEPPPDSLEGRTFQAHILPGNKVLLYLVELPEAARCNALLYGAEGIGEQCGRRVGHEGQHCWTQ